MNTIALLRDIAVVILAIEIFVMLLIPLAITFFAVKGVMWVQRQVHKYGPIVHGYFRKANQIAEETSHKVAAPVVVTSTNYVRIKRIRASLAAQLSRTF